MARREEPPLPGYRIHMVYSIQPGFKYKITIAGMGLSRCHWELVSRDTVLTVATGNSSSVTVGTIFL